MQELYTEIEINATPEEVWDILMDFSNYPEWNPFVTSINGEQAVGGKLTVELTQPDSKPMTMKPTVRNIEQNREFRWLGHLGIPRIFDGEHIFELEQLDENRVRFVQREKFRGILVPFLKKMLETRTNEGFQLMNQALKKRAEAGTA
ncbi:MAG: SRPBCC domain-containing protein [Candidatus Marinimicrobia bacterium]|nr:SRPBCC domain-containing protein [Candidatus Neomarinimicrobiota bacterium]MCF7828594.1 SRPBCC domain-containing protein [Candidatus Neomarinimicrobiota bacterium]MCF7880335.1 SRPBCC domain-containing protein [Candidatus Neomarinimicrobiota bacterium]